MRKKLIEVALPLVAISDASAKEKNVHTGLPANLHAWWSRKPLAAARAVLFASLVDDPSNDSSLTDEQVQAERQRLFKIMELLMGWNVFDDEIALNLARAEIMRCTGGNPPAVWDPFAGGGSIPLEAQRLGLKTYASDLNPVAVIVNKAQLEIVPRYANSAPVNPRDQASILRSMTWGEAQGLVADLEYYGEWMLKEARERIGYLYPNGPSGEEVIAWVWARTVKCPNPACGFQMPLVNKFWVSTHKGNEAWVQPVPNPTRKIVEFKSIKSVGVPPDGTVTKSGARCIVCGTPVHFEYIRSEGQMGRISYQLMSIAIKTQQGRRYIPPDELHIAIANEAQPNWIPETELPEKALGFRVQRYGLIRHSDLFTPRQIIALTTFSELVNAVKEQVVLDSNGDLEYANAIAVFLALTVDRLAQTNNTLVRWLVRKTGTSKGTPAFDRPIVPMVWEFSEGNVFADSVGSWSAALSNCLTAFKSFPKKALPGKVFQQDASVPSAIEPAPVISTDPPYFDNMGYAHLSDFFYIWLRRTIGSVYPDIFGTMLTPKKQELVADPQSFGGDQPLAEKHFMEGLRSAFQALGSHANREYPMTVYYAFKQRESENDQDAGEETVSSTGWEKMLEALVGANFTITGTWPIRTEQEARLRAIDSNALASSIVLVCRPRTDDASVTSRREFVNALSREMPAALHELQSGNIAPVDLAQAAIGPGMAVYSRYRKVLEANGEALSVRTGLQLINQELDAYFAEQEGNVDADTRFAINWFEQCGFREGEFGVADVLARAKNTSVEGVANAGVAIAGSGKVRLLSWQELEPGWDPSKDRRPTVWEGTHHLIERLNTHGEDGAAHLLVKMSSDLAAEARALAYRLYSVCERKGWADTARDYNALVVSWPRLQELANEIRTNAPPEQLDLL